MMSCTCRATSLRIFVQSLTDLRLSDSAIVTARRRILLHYPRVSIFQPQSIFSKPFSATTTFGFSQETPGNSESHSLLNSPASGDSQQNPSDDVTVDTTSAEVLDASADNLYRAKHEGTIFDFSSESIEALAANLNDLPDRNPTHRSERVEPAVRSKPKPKPKSVPDTGLSRLKRLKIIKKDKKKKKPDTLPPPQKEEWQIQKAALRQKFPEGWSPRKRLSPDALDGIRALHVQFPEDYSTEVLAEKFEVSPEAIRRILRSKWTPNPEEEEHRQQRWFNRGKQIWSQMAALGKKPPRRWRREGIVRDPSWNRPKGPRTQPPKWPRQWPRQVE